MYIYFKRSIYGVYTQKMSILAKYPTDPFGTIDFLIIRYYPYIVRTELLSPAFSSNSLYSFLDLE